MLAEQWRASNVRSEVGELDRAAYGQIGAALLVRDLDNGTARAQRRVIRNFLHAQHGRAGNAEWPQFIDCLVLSFVGKPLLNVSEDLEDVGLTCARRGIGWIVNPLRFT